MEYFGRLFTAVCLITSIAAGFVIPWRTPSLPQWKRGLAVFAGLVMIVGAVGFFGAALSAVGGLDWLPSTFEWPIGEATGVVTTPDGFHVVPHGPSSRVQVYDPEWKFVRGWRVRSLGLNSPLHAADDGTVDVFTRNRKHHVYDIEGDLLSTNEASFVLPERGQTVSVPTPIWLWVFTSPFYSWLTAALGMVLLFGLDRKLLLPQNRGGKPLH